jgi:hypothetical protein
MCSLYPTDEGIIGHIESVCDRLRGFSSGDMQQGFLLNDEYCTSIGPERKPPPPVELCDVASGVMNV